MKLTDINYYPVKSLAGIQLNQAQVTPLGILNDRTLMLVDDRDVFASQRKFPKMALVKTQLNNNLLTVIAPAMGSLEIDCDEIQSSKTVVKIWKDKCDVYVANNDINEWFSDFLGASVRLVKYDNQTPRPSDPNYSRVNDVVSFADGYPLLVISQASLDDLNNRLQQPVTMAHFRPNLVISGCEAFAEDSWKNIRVGEVVLDAVKPCVRCVLTTVNPQTGERNSEGEPLKTLSEYRRRGKGIYFGMNLIPRSLGKIHLGDPIEVDRV